MRLAKRLTTSSLARGLAMAAATAIGCVLLGYWNIVFEGDTLVSTSNFHPFADRYWEFLRMGDSRPPAFLNWHDQGATWWQWEPAAQFFSRAFRHGRVPLWDPTVAGGVDTHVNVTQGQYFPPYLAVLLAGSGPTVRDAYYLLLMAASGAFTFLLLHRNGLHPLASATAAVAWMLGGSMTLNINSIIGQSIATLPLLVLAMDWFLALPSPVRAAGLAVSVAIAILSSFIPVVVAGLALIAIQLLVHAAMTGGRRMVRRPHVSVLGWGVAGIAAGFAAAAFLIVPMFVVSRADVFFRTMYPNTGAQHYPFSIWPGLLSRVFPFSATQGASPFQHPGGDVNIFDVGLAPVLLALLASANGLATRRRLFVFLVLGAVYAFTRLFGIPPLHWIGYLPVFREMHFIPYGAPALALAVYGLAALGVENVVRGGVTARRAAVMTAVVVALVNAGLLFAASHQMQYSAVLRDPILEASRLLLLGTLVAAVAWASAARVIGGRTAGGLLLLAVIVELAPLARVDRFRRAPVWTEVPPYVRAMQSDNSRFRVLSADDLALTPNLNQAVGLEAVGSRHAINPWRYSRLVRTYFATLPTVYPIPTDVIPKKRVILNALNVKYVIVRGPSPDRRLQLVENDLRPFVTDGSFEVWHNPAVWPRAYLAGRYTVVPGFAAALQAVGDLELPDHVILEERPRAAVNAATLQGAESQIRDYAGEYVRIDAYTPAPAMLVLMDSFSEGWTATVNGRPAQILAANAAFRAVEVPAGKSEVVFRYVTPGLYAGLAISGLAIATLTGVGLWALVYKRRRSQMLPPGLRSQSGIAP